MKEFDKQGWLEDLAYKCELPVEQVMIAWAVYEAITRPEDCFDEVLTKVFKL